MGPACEYLAPQLGEPLPLDGCGQVYDWFELPWRSYVPEARVTFLAQPRAFIRDVFPSAILAHAVRSL
jgi:hypothetical protein